MLRLAATAGIAILSAAGASQAMILLDQARAPARIETIKSDPVPLQTSYVAPPAPASSTASVAKSADGHYWAQAEVNGKAVRFLVDTGASAVALTPSDAARLGFSSDKLIYDRSVQTANGEVKAAVVTLPNVKVAGANVRDVAAIVMQEGLETSLLGMTYLGRLSRFEATPNSLILRP